MLPSRAYHFKVQVCSSGILSAHPRLSVMELLRLRGYFPCCTCVSVIHRSDGNFWYDTWVPLFLIWIISCSSPLSLGVFSQFARVVFCVFSRVHLGETVLRFAHPKSFRLKSVFLFVSKLVAVLSFQPWSCCFRFRFSRTAFVLTSVVYFFMSTDDRRSIFDSSDNQPFHLKNASIQPFDQSRFVNGGDSNDDGAYGSAPSQVETLLSNTTVVAPASVTLESFRLLLDVQWLAAMHRNGARLVFVDARSGSTHDIALWAWKSAG